MNYKELGFLVLKFRRNIEVSQQKFADSIGISRNYLSMIERGKATHLSLEVLTRLADGMGVPVKELIE